MPYHPVTEKIAALLREHGVWFMTFEHEPVRTSEEAAAIRPDYTLAQGAKALIVKVKRRDVSHRSPASDLAPRIISPHSTIDDFIMVVVPGDKKFDTKKLKTAFGFSDLRFATEAEVGEITGGVQPGGVPPFGNIFGLTVYADEGVFQNEKIIFNAGDRAFSIGMYARDFYDLVKPERAHLAM